MDFFEKGISFYQKKSQNIIMIPFCTNITIFKQKLFEKYGIQGRKAFDNGRKADIILIGYDPTRIDLHPMRPELYPMCVLASFTAKNEARITFLLDFGVKTLEIFFGGEEK